MTKCTQDIIAGYCYYKESVCVAVEKSSKLPKIGVKLIFSTYWSFLCLISNLLVDLKGTVESRI